MADQNADVSEQPGQVKDAPASGAAAAGKGEQKDDGSKALREEIAQLRKSNEQLSASERYWAGRAQGAEPKAETEEEDEIDIPDPEIGDDDTPEKFVDDLSASGIKALQKRGLLTKKDAAAMIEEISTKVATKIVQQKATAMTSDAEIVATHPDLRDENSDLFKETGRIYRDLVKRDPALKKSPVTLQMAADKAKLILDAKKPAPAAQSDDEKEEARQARARAQHGQGGRRSSAEFVDDDSDAIGPGQRAVLEAFGKYGVDEASYQKHRKAGRNG